MSENNPRRYDETDRERGVLTKADREFLFGEKDDLQPQSKREARQRIRNRLQNSILDFALLSRALEESDREIVSERVFEDSSEGNLRLTQIFSLLYHMTVDTSGEPSRAIERFEDSLSDSIESALKRIEENLLIEVNLEIKVEGRDPSIESLLEKYEKNEESIDELMYLQRNDEIQMDEKYFNHMFERLWQTGRQFGFSSQSGEMNMLDPDDYEEMDNFIQEAMSRMIDLTDELEDNNGNETSG